MPNLVIPSSGSQFSPLPNLPSPHIAGCSLIIHLLKSNVQSFLHDNVPPEYASNEVHVFPPKAVLSHCSSNPAVFGFCIMLSPQYVVGGGGITQLLVSSKQLDVVHLNVPLA